jgi:hypothetical protein
MCRLDVGEMSGFESARQARDFADVSAAKVEQQRSGCLKKKKDQLALAQ